MPRPDVPAGAEIRKGHQPDRRQPAAADLAHPAGAGGVLLRGRAELCRASAPRREWRRRRHQPMCRTFSRPPTAALTKAFMRIKDVKLRRRIVDLVEQIAGEDAVPMS